jgi:hypothetical protein
MTAFSEQLKTLIAEDELELAVTRLVNYLKGSAPDLVNEVVLYSAQLARLRREARSQLLVQDDVRRQSARIAAGLLDFIDELPRRMERRCGFPVVTRFPSTFLTMSASRKSLGLITSRALPGLRTDCWLPEACAGLSDCGASGLGSSCQAGS